MINFSLECEYDHRFDGWFASSDDYEDQRARELVRCPVCDSCVVSKSLMAPKVSTARSKEKISLMTVDSARREVQEELKKLREKILESGENVGRKFPEEARKIHYGESEKKHVYGEATQEEVKELVEEGVSIAPVPILPEDVN